MDNFCLFLWKYVKIKIRAQGSIATQRWKKGYVISFKQFLHSHLLICGLCS